jgi:hypothetical protein
MRKKTSQHQRTGFDRIRKGLDWPIPRTKARYPHNLDQEAAWDHEEMLGWKLAKERQLSWGMESELNFPEDWVELSH